MKRLHSIITSCLFLFLSCNIFQTSSDVNAGLLPNEFDVPGWRIVLSIKGYTEIDIHEYLKKDSNLYEKYGIKELRVAKYRRVDDYTRDITAEIYRMNSTLNAFGIFSFERVFEHNNLEICGNAYSKPGGIFTRKGSYYIKVEANREYEGAIDDLVIFTQLICDNIRAEENGLPEYITLFGDNTLNNLVYGIDGHPEFPQLKNFFIKKIDIIGEKRFIFFLKRDSSYETLTEFSNILKDKKNPFVLSSAEELQIAFQKKGKRDFLFISVYKEWFFGVISATSMLEGKKIVNQLYNELLEFEGNN